jgi:ABC-type multidrug transport system fused ATPase/permease subunit
MALPLTLIGLGSRFAAAPLVAGLALEILRSVVRRGLKRQLRFNFLHEIAVQALDKNTISPEADVESAFWAAQLTEFAIAVDVPALLAATLAAATILALAAATVGGAVMSSLLTLLLVMLGFTIWNSRRRASAVNAVVEHRQRAAGWVAAAERDSGEIHGERARAPFLARLTRSVQVWSAAEDRLERARLLDRLLLGALFLVGVLAIFRSQHIDPFHLAPSESITVSSLSGLLMLSTGIPVGYVFAIHADSLLTGHASLIQLLKTSGSSPIGLRALERRPARITARSLSFSYSLAAPEPALACVDFEVDLKKITLIVAPNGGGKTTLAKLMCGVLTPDVGALEIDGIACSDISRDDFGFVPQNPLIVETLSIEENVRLVAPTAPAHAINQLLLELGLRKPVYQLAGELSRGEQRRIAIARAILKEPRLLLLDEPDVWLDSDGRALLARVLEDQVRTRAVVVISHRRDWLPSDANVIDLERHLSGAASSADPVGKSSACG